MWFLNILERAPNSKQLELKSFDIMFSTLQLLIFVGLLKFYLWIRGFVDKKLKDGLLLFKKISVNKGNCIDPPLTFGKTGIFWLSYIILTVLTSFWNVVKPQTIHGHYLHFSRFSYIMVFLTNWFTLSSFHLIRTMVFKYIVVTKLFNFIQTF